MQLEVTFRNLNPREEVRKRAEALYTKLERFLDPAAEAHLVVAIEHQDAICELVVTSRGVTSKALETDPDLRTALDRTFHTIEEQLRRSKDKRAHHDRGRDREDGFVADEG
jgi:ribosomal subunit interface protein